MGRSPLLLAAACFLAVATEARAGLDLTVRVVKGESGAAARRNHFMPWRPLGANGRVPELSEVHCEQGCTLKVDQDNTLELSPGTIVAVTDFLFVPLIEGAPSLSSAHQVELREGSVVAHSTNDKGIPLVVSTSPAQHVALRNAEAQVTYHGGRTAVGVHAGLARVGSNRNWLTVTKGQSSVLLNVGRPTSPQPLIAPPVWSSGENCPPAVAVTEPPTWAAAGGCWAPIEGAHYEVEVARDANFHDLLTAPERIDKPQWSSPLSVGRYFSRVRAIDSDGLVGDPSSPRQLAIIPLVLPPGASANLIDRTIIVPEGREVQFGDPKGLELAVDKSGFSKAPATLRMNSDPEHQLRFRLKDDPSSTSTVLFVRRALKADVQITPRLAHWPSDPIQISVTLTDPSGHSDPSKVQAQLKVMVGMHEVPVKWAHQGATWSTRLEPQRHVAPTVIRVIAEDEFGTPLGRNFLEVDNEPRVATR